MTTISVLLGVLVVVQLLALAKPPAAISSVNMNEVEEQLREINTHLVAIRVEHEIGGERDELGNWHMIVDYDESTVARWRDEAARGE